MEALLKILSEYGVAGFVLILTITIIFRLLAKDYNGQLGVFLGNLKSGHKISNNSDLKYHPFFSSAHYKIVVELPALDLSPDKPVKQEMFRDLLIINIQCMLNACQTITDTDMTDWPGEKWSNEISKELNRMVMEFHEKATNAGIPDVVLFKFQKWHYPTLEMLYEYINTIGASSIYPTNITRTNTFLLVMNLLLVTTIGDAERSLKEINGEVGGKMYKNQIIEH